MHFFAVFFTKKIFIFLDLRVKVKKIKESEKRAIFSTSPEGLGGGLTNGHLVCFYGFFRKPELKAVDPEKAKRK